VIKKTFASFGGVINGLNNPTGDEKEEEVVGFPEWMDKSKAFETFDQL
jgi:hypothetical protein